MAHTATCKFTVLANDPVDEDEPMGPCIVKMEAIYDMDVEEDRHFTQATPWGHMSFRIDNPKLEGFFRVGQAYHIEIKPADEG